LPATATLHEATFADILNVAAEPSEPIGGEAGIPAGRSAGTGVSGLHGESVALSVNTKQVNVQAGPFVVLDLRLPQLELTHGRQ
jgi:hypothetical protein